MTAAFDPVCSGVVSNDRAESESGLFDRFASHYDALWHDASTPVEPAEQPDGQPAREPIARAVPVGISR
jgi:hypothetical protein